MLTIQKEWNQTELTVILEGRLDTLTAPKLEAELRTSLSNVTRLIFDLSALEYISSAGLRVLLTAQKVMNRQDDMIVKGASDVIMEIFEVTGFVDILTLE